ncbi:MAG TPA: ornithine cyclodeaminase family protein [Pararobbsia sp.]|jgi:ornithine cyclodeaminase/alanine dehydrogenase-like protein (mu-crystallin family)|nr:ornithine cyclodeaminase family protein [Pararobbsia sp.]
MTLLLTHEDVRKAVSMQDAIDAMEAAFAEEGRGAALLPQRINMKLSKGWLRVGPVALEESRWMGFKAMNLTPGQGVRYQVHLYSMDDGSLKAIMDAQHLTTLRTGATSAVATRRLARPGAGEVAVLGSGVEARAQIEAMIVAGYVKRARVFSPTAANRKRLCDDMRAAYGVDMIDVDNAEDAVTGADIVVAAVKAGEPVLFGRWLKPGTHVNSVGTARRDQREIDVETFTRSSLIVVDTREGVFTEAGDAYAAREAVSPESALELHELAGDVQSRRTSDEQITLFKSVGTGIQDIALAAVIYRNALAAGLGNELGEFPYLKQA